MKFDPSRAFPYPLLRPHVDDYVDAHVSSTARFEIVEDDLLRIDVSMDVGVPELRELVSKGDARYETVVKCRGTYTQHKVVSDKPVYHAILPPGYFTGMVTVYTYLVATRRITGFRSPSINPEFGDGPFEFPRGSMLAVYRAESAEISREAFKDLYACFEFQPTENLADWRADVSATDDSVRVLVNPRMMTLVMEARKSDRTRAILFCSIYMQAVQQCVSLLRNNTREYEGNRWARIFRQRAKILGIEMMAGSEMSVAQALLGDPFQKIDEHHLREEKIV